MNNLARYTAWLCLLPFRLIALTIGLFSILTLFITGLGKSYIAKIITNILSNIFTDIGYNLDTERLKHTHILGATGCGKSSAIEFFIDQNIRKQQGFLLVEPHGELVERVLRNKRLALKHRSQSYKQLIFLDFDTKPPQLNIFKLPLPHDAEKKLVFVGGLSADLADAFAQNMRPAPTEAQNMMLRNIIMAGFYIHHARFSDMITLLQSDSPSTPLFHQLVHDLPLPPLQQYFQSDFFSSNTRATKEALRLRLTNFVTDKQMFECFYAEHCEIDFKNILEKNQFVLVKATTALLGSYQAKTIGNIIHNLLNKYAFERLIAGKPSQPFFVYFDEAQHYVNSSVQKALTGARKTGLNYTLSHHELSQDEISNSQQRTIINETNVKIYGNIKWKDQKQATNILKLSNQKDLDTLQAGEFYIKAGKYDVKLHHFPSKFAAKIHAQDSSWFYHPYMSAQDSCTLQSYLAKIRTEKPHDPTMYEIDKQQYPVQNHDIQNAIISNFSLHGRKRFKENGNPKYIHQG